MVINLQNIVEYHLACVNLIVHTVLLGWMDRKSRRCEWWMDGWMDDILLPPCVRAPRQAAVRRPLKQKPRVWKFRSAIAWARYPASCSEPITTSSSLSLSLSLANPNKNKINQIAEEAPKIRHVAVVCQLARQREKEKAKMLSSLSCL